MKFTALTLAFMFSVFAQAEPIEDNSLLLEEAYNQEAGIYQFIFKYEIEKSKDWTLQFDNEIPVGGQDHQLSYSVPFVHSDAAREEGLGDASLSYRYQLMHEEKVSLAPRIGLVFPSGEESKGLGSGGLGVEFNFAASFKVHPRFAMHMNAGAKFTPESKAGGLARAELENTYGLSGIYHLSDNLDFMLESKGEGEDLFLAPGIRAAMNSGTWQIVPALAYSRNVKPYTDEYSLIAYLSLEGPI